MSVAETSHIYEIDDGTEDKGMLVVCSPYERDEFEIDAQLAGHPEEHLVPLGIGKPALRIVELVPNPDD